MTFRHERLVIALSSMGIGISALSAFAQQAPQRIEKIEVTGSNIKRIEGESAVPVQVITREQIERTGATTPEQLLQTLSVALQGNNNTVAAMVAGSNTAGVTGASLRGLGSQRTLVLINGRRVSAGGSLGDSTTVDINSIPLAAVERVEVLKDGASAIYGSDAIGGVLNFILRRNYQGAEGSVYYGDTNDGGGSIKRLNATAGFGDLGRDRYNVMLTGSYQKSAALFGRERNFAKSGINEGALNDTTSGNTFPANILIPDVGTRNPTVPNCAPSVVSPLAGPRVCRYDPSAIVALLPQAERSSLYGAAHFALTPDVDAYAEASYARNRQHTILQASPISDQFALPDTHPLVNVAPYNSGLPGVGVAKIVLSPSSPFYPTAFIQSQTGGATPDVLVRYRSVNIGNREFTDISEQPRVVLGVKGTLAGWDFDTAYLYTETKLTEHINAGIDLFSKILPLLNSGQVNFFGPNTPAIQAQLDATQFIGDAYSVKSSINSLSAKVSKELFQLPGGPLALAFGAEGRKEKFSVDVAPELQIGDTTQYGGTNLPVDKSRDVTGVFGELSIPIVKSLEAGVAVRYDDYQGTGSKTTPKVSLRWQPSRQLLLRTSYGKGFRAPSLTDLYQPQITAVSAPGLNDPARCRVRDANGVLNEDSNDCGTQFNILTGGNTQLKPEESDNFTLGLVFEPTNSVSVALDAFKIKLKNTIIFGVDTNAILNNPTRFASFITRGAPDPSTPGLPGHVVQINQTNLNFGETRVDGLDIDLRLRLPAGEAGNFTIALNGTYFDKYEIQNLDGTFVSVNGKVSPIVNGAGGAIPRWRHYLSADWAKGPWDLTVTQNFQNGYEDIPGTFEETVLEDGSPNPAFKPRHVGTYETYDLQGSYSGIKNLRLALGIKNVFNRDPPYTNAGGQNFFQAGYDPGYADPRGRFYYGSLTYAFK
jgi:iron complex outermembrane receptor protein